MVNQQKITKNVYKVTAKFKYLILVLLFLIVFLTRLYFSFQTPEFSDDSAYFTLYQVRSITETGFPDMTGRLSAGTSFFPPVFYYLLAFFNLFIPIGLVGKIIPNLLASLIVFIVYALSVKFTKHHTASLLAASLSGFIPVFFLRTFNSVSIYSLVVPLVLFSFYSFLMISSNDKFIPLYIFSIIALSFTHPSVFFVVLGQIIYFALVKVEGLQYKNVEIEVILVSLFLVIWSQFLIFKNAFLIYGPSIIWQNVPSQIVSQMFSSITILDAIFLMGMIPTVAGAFVFFQYVKDKKSKFIFFFLSYSIPIFIMLWLQLIMPVVGLILLSSALVVVLGRYYQTFIEYLEKTKFSSFKVPIIFFVVVMIYLTSISPTFSSIGAEVENAPPPDKVLVLEWVKENTEEDSIILSSYDDGFLIKYYSRRNTVMDSNFLIIEDVDVVLDDIETFYKTIYLIDALKIIEKYNVDYVFVSDKVIERYGQPAVLDNEECFWHIFSGKDNTNNLYEVTCSLVSVGDGNV